MLKNDLVVFTRSKVEEITGKKITKKDAEALLDSICEKVLEGVLDDEKATLPKIGTLYLSVEKTHMDKKHHKVPERFNILLRVNPKVLKSINK